MITPLPPHSAAQPHPPTTDPTFKWRAFSAQGREPSLPGCAKLAPHGRTVVWQSGLRTCGSASYRSAGAVQGGMRSFLADYGVPLLVVVWSGVSFILEDATPSGIPRRLSMPNTWAADATRNWDAVSRLGDVTGGQIGYAAIPGLIIALLFYFDHNVSAQLAQQKDFQLVRPPAYNWDLALVALLMVCSHHLPSGHHRPLCHHVLLCHRAPRHAPILSFTVQRSYIVNQQRTAGQQTTAGSPVVG